tara:strand:+ start:816 stop:1355 length:540 start_codon:yes stop_codon:yes gene_type:complete
MEIWKAVLDYEGLYEISQFGNVRRIARGKRLSPTAVEHIRLALDNGATLKAAAVIGMTTLQTVFAIKHGKTWVGDVNSRPVKTKIGTDFYVYFTPSKDGKYKHRPIHRVLWEAFNGRIPKGFEVNHINLNRQDNRLENLELVTHQQNIKHAIDRYKSKGLLRSVKGVKGFVKGKHSEYD